MALAFPQTSLADEIRATDDWRDGFDSALLDDEETRNDTRVRVLEAVEAAKARKTAQPRAFTPKKPAALSETGLAPDFVEKLLCRYLLTHGAACGRSIGHAVGLPFRLIEPILTRLKEEMLVTYRSTAAVGDYQYVLTEAGAERAQRYMRSCTWAETAPVPLADYIASVAAQSLTLQTVTVNELERAFADLMLTREMLDRLGPAVAAGRGMFLYGAPGNGKTSIAERVVRSFGNEIWMPRALLVDDVVVRLFDPVLHELAHDSEEISTLLGEPLEDARWVRIKRPAVVVGGELTMDQLEMRHDPVSNVSEAPLQMKSNCGVLLIDDFGRQSMPVQQLLNRWIVPLEKRYDFQKLPTGKKIQVPFDQLVVFSTNLVPKDLVDEAFLRRLPYKIEVPDPSREQFHRIAQLVAPGVGLKPTVEQIDALIDRYSTSGGRPLRCCHPRDLMLQVRSYCLYRGLPLEMSEEAIDFAVRNYFSVM